MTTPNRHGSPRRPRHVHQPTGDGGTFLSEDDASAVLLGRNVAWICGLSDHAKAMGVPGDVMTIDVTFTLHTPP